MHRFHFSGEEESASKEEILIKLMDSYGDMVKKLAFTYVKDINLAEDITQDVFISCYNNLHLFRENSSYKTWIYRIAINRSKDVVKSNAYKRILPFKKFTVTSREKTPDLKLIDKNTHTTVTESLLNLPSKYREILYFFYYEELKLREISEITSLKEATVKTRLSRGRQLLKKELERRRFEYE
ncbi:sigma-70 family RNA polymerase sigma factor [Mesobacillus jeotgali]|uniref:sigma-70 family RNA polymerase sigma factor n=1 Tax=Mesobacillus jeotgali TaxID=129985 RepID=UPI00177C1EF6|nr:sigma-70 family RNA polymerase sigma factor [Mesobacillus jeotgali]UYZ22304.1 sigma-70 family RNA polymerase sigma factor [Mesobacillus jeotgali]